MKKQINSIESITISSKLATLKEDWSKVASKVNNPSFKLFENKFIIGTSSNDNDAKYAQLFLYLKKMTTPNFIQHLCPHSKEMCIDYPCCTSLI